MHGGSYPAGRGFDGPSFLGSGPPPGSGYGGPSSSGPPPGYGGGAPPIANKAVNLDGPMRARKSFGGMHLPALFAGLIVVVALIGGAVYLFAFGGVDQLSEFFSPPSASPTVAPTGGGLFTEAPTVQPTVTGATNSPTNQPVTGSPTTAQPTRDPTNNPTNQPTRDPTNNPTNQPTRDPTNNPTNQPTTRSPTGAGGTISPTPLPTTLRPVSSPYVVVTFTSPPTTPTSAVTAFANAAARWSTILAGTNLATASITPGDTFNDFSCGLNNDVAIPVTTISELHVAADISAIDGVGGVLGRAGPCSGFLESVDRPGVFLPVLGAMTFDNADIANLEAAGELEDVILHEMGHVLGMGTLWSGSAGLGLPQLLINPIFPPGGGTPVPGNIPLFVGHGARSEYTALSGLDEDIPVEDGSFQGLSPSQILAGQGQGSIDGHWMENLFVNELMTPAIGGSVNPLSIMSLRSLEDVGYGVDTSQADAYSIPGPSSAARGIARTQHQTVLKNDIFICPDLAKGLEKARNRARARRRLGGPTMQSLHDG